MEENSLEVYIRPKQGGEAYYVEEFPRVIHICHDTSKLKNDGAPFIFDEDFKILGSIIDPGL